MARAAGISLLIFVTSGMCALAADTETRKDGFFVTTETFAANDGVLEMRLDAAAIRQAGLTLLGDAEFVADLSLASGEYRVLSVNDRARVETGGDMAMRCAPFGLAAEMGPAEMFEAPRFVHDITGGSSYAYSILDRTSPVFRLTAMRMELRRDFQALVLEADVRVARQLAERLGLEAAAGAVIGSVFITMRMDLLDRVVADVRQSTTGYSTVERRLLAGAFNGTPGPDVIVGDLPATEQFGRVGPMGSGTVGLSIGTTSCNKGDTPFNWFALPNTDHPMIPMNMYRLKIVDGAQRFEQIGQSWMKHGFTALQFNACDFGCTPNPNGTRLGVGCSDPYSVALNASQCGLGPRSALNPYTGEIPSGFNLGSGGGCSRNYPAQNHRDHDHDDISHRLQVLDVDLLRSLNTGATYFAEGQYITPHEFAVANGNQLNNVSHRPVGVSAPDDDGVFTFTNLAPTVREQPAITAWTGATLRTVEPEPFTDGLAIVGYRVTNLGLGQRRYEYAVYNMNLDRSIRLFRVPVPSGVNITNIGFHAPLNHAAEPGAATYSNDAWEVSTTTGAVEWSTATLADDPLANAIRFGTLYNFRFDADSSDRDAEATLGFFKTGDPRSVEIRGPSAGLFDCNQNGVNDACDFSCSNIGCDVPGCGGSFDCNNNTLPDECDIEAGRAFDCNNDGIPDDCEGCADDCECDDGLACTSGTCVSGACVQEVLCDVGMLCDAESQTCRDCIDSGECEDGDQCTDDRCSAGRCTHSLRPCLPGLVCDSSDGECKECVSDGNCSSGLVCDTTSGTCEECVAADDCDDGEFCNGSESCVDNQCQAGGDPCPGRHCRSSDKQCVDCLSASDCDDSDPCDGIETCSESGMCESGALESDCDDNGIEDDCDINVGAGRDCQPNGILDACDITAGTSLDEDGNGVPDECLTCESNADCLDSLACTFDLCVDETCTRQDSLYGDVAGLGGTCGPDGQVALQDILAVLDAFQGTFAPPCTLPNMDIACGPGASCCIADGNIDLLDILAVLNAFQGIDGCCPVSR